MLHVLALAGMMLPQLPMAWVHHLVPPSKPCHLACWVEMRVCGPSHLQAAATNRLLRRSSAAAGARQESDPAAQPVQPV